MRSLIFLLATLLSAPVWSKPAPPQAAKSEATRFELIAENAVISAGQNFYLGVKISHAPGDHTYWKHPGIVGLPTSVKWSLPEGFVAGEIEWPVPQPVKMAEYTAQGYEGETLLMIPITAAKNLADRSVKLDAKISWMACGTACHPHIDEPFSITLPVGEQPVLRQEARKMFEKSRKLVPRESVKNFTVTAKKVADGFVLTIAGDRSGKFFKAVKKTYFFTEDGQVDSNAPQVVTVGKNNEATLTLKRAEDVPKDATSLSGVLVVGSFPPTQIQLVVEK